MYSAISHSHSPQAYCLVWSGLIWSDLSHRRTRLLMAEIIRMNVNECYAQLISIIMNRRQNDVTIEIKMKSKLRLNGNRKNKKYSKFQINGNLNVNNHPFYFLIP